jgi:hypothetical protein
MYKEVNLTEQYPSERVPWYVLLGARDKNSSLFGCNVNDEVKGNNGNFD